LAQAAPLGSRPERCGRVAAMANEALGVCGAGCFVFLLVLISSSWTTLMPTEMALGYNWLLQTVSPEVVISPGLQITGPFVQLLKYPKTIQTIEYSAEMKDILDDRTHDGLPLLLGVAFQYRLLPDGLYNLYHKFENNVGDYERLFVLSGIHIVTEVATRFTAYQFFNEKQKIAEVMRREVDAYFQEHLYATVESLQINEDDLPEAFTQMILQAATSKQRITRMEKTRDAKIVEFHTARIVAHAQANVTIQKAFGERHRILQNGRADAAIIDAYVQAELEAYGKIHDELGLEGDSLLKYIWYDTLGGGGVAASDTEPSDIELLFGVNPSAYISETGR